MAMVPREAAPDALCAFDEAESIAAAVLPAAVAPAVYTALARVLRHPAEHDRLGIDVTEPTDPSQLVAVRFAEQFAIDVTGIDASLRAELGAAFGADTFPVVQAIYVADVFQRGRIALERVFDGWFGPIIVPPDGVASDALWPVLERFMAVVARLDCVDPLTTEVVRLRGAVFHDCRVCRSRRSVRALDAVTGSVERLDALVAAPATLDEPVGALLALVDAVVTQPSEIGPELVAALRHHHDDAVIVEVVLDVVRNAANKIAVAFGADAPVVREGIEFFDLDASGAVVASVDASAVRAATA